MKEKKKSFIGRVAPDASHYKEYIIDGLDETSRSLIKDFKDCKKVRITIEEV